MTPANLSAQKRAEAENLIRQHAPQRLQAALIDSLRPAIALDAARTDDSEIPLGASKFGGAPDLPADFEWPLWNEKPLGFLAQINLEEVAPFDIQNQLPKDGLLSFFYYLGDEEEWPFGEPEEKAGARVFYSRLPVERAEVPQGSAGNSPLHTASIRFEAFWSQPHSPYWITAEQPQTLSKEEKDKWRELAPLLYRNPGHILLGYPQPIQDDGRNEAARYSQRGTFSDWNLLFQMDTDDEINFMWGDAGTIYYFIHSEELGQHDFSQTWLVAQCG